MSASSSSPTLPPPLLETLLQRAPVDVLLFDTALICQYVAPAADTLLGQTPEQLAGRHARDIFPPTAHGLLPMLERAAHDAAAWHTPEYRFTYREHGSEALFCWAIRVEPVAVESFRGVLITLADVHDLADENDHLRAENARLRAHAGALHPREQTQVAALHDLQERVRSLLAPAVGYLQAIARRPALLAGRSPAAVIEERVLPRLHDVVDAVDRAGEPGAPRTSR